MDLRESGSKIGENLFRSKKIKTIKNLKSLRI